MGVERGTSGGSTPSPLNSTLGDVPPPGTPVETARGIETDAAQRHT